MSRPRRRQQGAPCSLSTRLPACPSAHWVAGGAPLTGLCSTLAACPTMRWMRWALSTRPCPPTPSIPSSGACRRSAASSCRWAALQAAPPSGWLAVPAGRAGAVLNTQSLRRACHLGWLSPPGHHSSHRHPCLSLPRSGGCRRGSCTALRGSTPAWLYSPACASCPCASRWACGWVLAAVALTTLCPAGLGGVWRAGSCQQ